MEQVVIANRDIEEVPRRDARRIMVVVLSVRRRHLYKTGPELRCQADRGERGCRRGVDSAAVESSLELFISRQWSTIAEHFDRRLAVERSRGRAVIPGVDAVTRRSSGYLSTVVAPAEREPGAALP